MSSHITHLEQALASSKRAMFAKKTEKVRRAQLSLFTDVIEAVVGAEAPVPDAGGTPPRKPPTKKAKTKTKLEPTREETIRVPEDERPCPGCGGDRATLGYSKSLTVEYIPARVEVVRYSREKVVCRACEGNIRLADTPADRVIEGAMPGPGMLTAIVVNKVVDGLPLNRTLSND